MLLDLIVFATLIGFGGDTKLTFEIGGKNLQGDELK